MIEPHTFSTAIIVLFVVWYMSSKKFFSGRVWDIAKGVLLAYGLLQLLQITAMMLVAFVSAVWYNLFP